MKKAIIYGLCLTIALLGSGCSDDDEPNLPVTPESIAGTWQLTHEEGWEIYDGEKESWSENFPDEYGWYMTYTFDKDGSFTEIEFTNNKPGTPHKGSYSISGKELRIDRYTLLEINKLTKSQLILVERGKDEIENASFEDIMIFKRIE